MRYGIMDRRHWRRLSLLFIASFIPVAAPLTASNEEISSHGERAISLESQAWQQLETDHFVIHYAQDFIGKPVGVEAEFYRRYITTELEIDTPHSESRSHIFIFENREGWHAFASAGGLEAWTGAVAIGQELFVPRYPEYRFKGNSLGHEVAHLMVNRYIPGRLPLWLSEGYAEEVSIRAYAAFLRGRGYRAKPRVLPVSRPFPLEELLAFTEYPDDPARVSDFYRQSRQLVGFIFHKGGKANFPEFMRLMASGRDFDTALIRTYRQWRSVKDLEAAFTPQMLLGDEPDEDPRPERDE